MGYDKTSTDCTGQAMLKCPFDQSKVFCAGTGKGDDGSSPSPCNIGDFLYSDYTCSSTAVYGKVIVGIVFADRAAVSLNYLASDTRENIEKKVAEFSLPGTVSGQWNLPEDIKVLCNNKEIIEAAAQKIGRRFSIYKNSYHWTKNGYSGCGSASTSSKYGAYMVLYF